MAVTVVAAQTLPGAYPTLQPGAGTQKLTHVAIDAGLGGQTPIIDSKTTLFVVNTGSVGHTITIGSVVDVPFNRAGDITAYNVPAGEVHVFGPFKTAGWSNAGNLTFNTSDVSLEVGVVTLP